MRTINALFLSVLIVLLPGCGMLSPQQRDAARQTVEDEYDAGNITRAQRDAAVEALDNDEPFDWETLGIVGLNIMLGLVGGPMVVRKMRGPSTQKVGLPESKVIKK